MVGSRLLDRKGVPDERQPPPLSCHTRGDSAMVSCHADRPPGTPRHHLCRPDLRDWGQSAHPPAESRGQGAARRQTRQPHHAFLPLDCQRRDPPGDLLSAFRQDPDPQLGALPVGLHYGWQYRGARLSGLAAEYGLPGGRCPSPGWSCAAARGTSQRTHISACSTNSCR